MAKKNVGLLGVGGSDRVIANGVELEVWVDEFSFSFIEPRTRLIVEFDSSRTKEGSGDFLGNFVVPRRSERAP